MRARSACSAARTPHSPRCAALLTNQPVTLRDVPNLADIKSLRNLLGELGCIGEHSGPAGQAIMRLHTQDESLEKSHARYEIVRTMRASISTLGPMLARRGFARVSMPGGAPSVTARWICTSGVWPPSAPRSPSTAATSPPGAPKKGLKRATIFLGGQFGSTVLGTANVMCAATLAKGTTVIESAACEPEIVDLAVMLIKMGRQDQRPRLAAIGHRGRGRTQGR